MKRKKRLFGILLVITALIIMQLPVAEADAATSASDFKIEGSTLVKYRGKETNVTIPDTVEIIGQKAFEENDKIELVVIPNSVTLIEPYAFWGCDNLDNVVLGQGLTEVGDFVFANCKALNHMSIPSTIRKIGIQSFADCVSMTDISIAPEVTNIHETAFDGCYKLKIHCEPGCVADYYAKEFYERQKEMPEYEDVENYQPENNTMEEVPVATKTPENNVVTETGEYLGSTKVVGNQAVLFVDNTGLTVLDGQQKMQSSVEAEIEELVQQGGVISGSVAKYSIVDGKVIADQAYYKKTDLQNIALPEGVEEIGLFAFARSSVEQINIPEGVTDIRYGAFYHCDNLTEVILPTSIENVEPKAFAYTPWVENFEKTDAEEFLISGNVLVAYNGGKAKVTVPDGVKVIAGEVFQGHDEMKEITIPDSVVTIGEGAFENCKRLHTIYFGNTVAQIKDRAFCGCSLSEVTLPASVVEVGVKAFDENVKLAYEGQEKPKQSHELSAERLSNEDYRNCAKENKKAGVITNGLEGSSASLEGAARSYSLTITEANDISALTKAYQRSFHTAIPAGIQVYDFVLMDNSNIPITKLGKQLLTVTIPVPEEFQSQSIQVFTLDRNGQMEIVNGSRVMIEGIDSFRFDTDYVSQIGINGTGNTLDAGEILEETTSIEQLSAGPVETRQPFPYQWIIGGILLGAGVVLIFSKH